MLGNVLLLCFFVFFIFGIVGVQLWKGVLRNRCFFEYNHTLMAGLVDESYQRTYYKPEHTDSFICTSEIGAGMSTCADIPPYVNNSHICNSTIETVLNRFAAAAASTFSPYSTSRAGLRRLIHSNETSSGGGGGAALNGAVLRSTHQNYHLVPPSYSHQHHHPPCINWNYYYSKCRPSGENPFKGAISFDNIGYAWVAIFQVKTYKMNF